MEGEGKKDDDGDGDGDDNDENESENEIKSSLCFVFSIGLFLKLIYCEIIFYRMCIILI